MVILLQKRAESYGEGPPPQLNMNRDESLTDDPTQPGQIEYVEFLKMSANIRIFAFCVRVGLSISV